VAQRHALENRVSTGERTDARIVESWTETIRGNLETAERAADRARAGLVAGQASSWVLGASAWRCLDLAVLGRWDEALLDAERAERAWAESELEAPGYAVNGFLAAFGVARSRGDVVGATHWRDLVERIYQHSDASIRNQRLAAYLEDDVDKLDAIVADYRVFTPRLDYVFLALSRLADLRHATPVPSLDALNDYAVERGLGLISSQVLRLRGIASGERGDLEAALADFERMNATPFIARAHAELGMLLGDAALIDRGLDELAAVGDVEHATRIARVRTSEAAAQRA
jgi:hypothetical protein